MKEEIAKILKYGVLEMRILTAGDVQVVDKKRLNILANILHNLPEVLISNDLQKQFNLDELKKNVADYGIKYSDTIVKI